MLRTSELIATMDVAERLMVFFRLPSTARKPHAFIAYSFATSSNGVSRRFSLLDGAPTQ